MYIYKCGLLTKAANIVAKGEIARFEQFIFLSQCFQNPSALSESVYMWGRVKDHLLEESNIAFV